MPYPDLCTELFGDVVATGDWAQPPRVTVDIPSEDDIEQMLDPSLPSSSRDALSPSPAPSPLPVASIGASSKRAPPRFQKRKRGGEGPDLAQALVILTDERRAKRLEKTPKEEAVSTIWRLYGDGGDDVDLEFILAACEVMNTDENRRIIWMAANKTGKDRLLEKWLI